MGVWGKALFGIEKGGFLQFIVLIQFSIKNNNHRNHIMNPQTNFCLFPERGLGETALFGIEKGGFLQFIVKNEIAMK